MKRRTALKVMAAVFLPGTIPPLPRNRSLVFCDEQIRPDRLKTCLAKLGRVTYSHGGNQIEWRVKYRKKENVS